MSEDESRIDYGWEALVEVTGADIQQERGALNAALSSIRRLTEEMDLSGPELGMMIRHRAGVYHEVFPTLPCTATALAKWWDKVLPEKERLDAVQAKRDEEAQAKQTRGVNLFAKSDCVTCGGDHWVVIRYRLPVATLWMMERGIEAGRHPADRGFEETAPCPACNMNPPIMRSFWDGRAWNYGSEPGELVIP